MSLMNLAFFCLLQQNPQKNQEKSADLEIWRQKRETVESKLQ
jgi:hypothetical protein